MKLHIRTQEQCTREELRKLLLEVADDYAGRGHQVLEPRLPWDGHPALLADAQGRPLLLSFDPENNQAALVNGLTAIEQLCAALPWINQVYDALRGKQLRPHLLVVSPEPPPGADAVLEACHKLTFFTFKIVNVNADTGIWLQPLASTGSATETPAKPHAPAQYTGPRIAAAPAQREPGATNNTLTDEERNYFQQL